MAFRAVAASFTGALVYGAGILSAARADEVQPPVAGRPPGFQGAVGSFRVTAEAHPTNLQAGDALVFTLHIRGPAHTAPVRPELSRLREFARRFVVEDLPGGSAVEGRWEYRYRLRPRSTDADAIPAFRFVYYKPGVVPPEKGFRTASTPAIPLVVWPRQPIDLAEVETPPGVQSPPEPFRRLAENPEALLRRDEPFALPSKLTLLACLLGPLAVCGAWYAVERRGSDHRIRRQHQSRAARRAFAELKATKAASAEEVAAIVYSYLQARAELISAEPTPEEVARHVQSHGFGKDAGRLAALVFARADEARFSRAGARGDATAMAIELIQGMEAAG
jgi:hypothetical protein